MPRSQFAQRLSLAALGSAGILSILMTGFGQAAQALSIVPQQEGEVNVGLGSSLAAGGYLGLSPLVSSILSLEDPSTGTRSRLFVDKAGTNNTYGGIRFQAKDIGTSDAAGLYWFRPVAMQADGVTPFLEQGQLEVGRFQINFAKVMAEVDVTWFDTEFLNASKGQGTGYTVQYADGTSASGFIAAGANNNIQTTNLKNVTSLILDVGERRKATGDGVNFSLGATEADVVPTPNLLVGLGALAVANFKRRRNASSEASSDAAS